MNDTVIERIWAMPSKQTFSIKPIKELLLSEIDSGTVVEPFAYIGTLKKLFADNPRVRVIDNDLNPEYDTCYHMDAVEFMKTIADSTADIVVYDPPYSSRQVSECYKGVGKTVTQEDTRGSFWSKAKKEIARILKPNGKAMCFGWNSTGIGITKGFSMKRILLVPHGGSRNDTICTVEIKSEVINETK